jgi:2,6-dihydroxypyridine 3-monooxygenase
MKEENESFSDTNYGKNILGWKQKNFYSSSAHTKNPKVVVIGGSLGGLFTAIALYHTNCDVEVFEKSSVNMNDHGAGIVLQMETVNFLKEHNIISNGAVISIPSYKRQYLKKDNTIASEEPILQLMTSWGLLYRILRHVFPNKHYHNDRKMTSFEQKKDDNIVVNFKGDSKEKECDLLVGADGAGSTVRHQLLPQVLPHYAGYVAWRGLVSEDTVSPKVLDIFLNKFTFFIGQKTHILCYLIPGSNGELSIGRRRLNWVWYVNAPVHTNILKKIMTDKNGKLQAFSVPQGMVNEDSIKEQKTAAEDILPDSFQQIVFATKEPFIQSIYDLSVSKMAFDRTCLIGDASFVVRPHTAAATSKAVKNAVALAKSVKKYRRNIDKALEEWEPSQLAIGKYILSLGIRLGNRSQI